MANLRDMTNPSGADIEVYVNQQIQKAMSNIAYGGFASSSGGSGFKAADYDIQVTKANHFPGMHWEFVSAIGVGIDCYIVWRTPRAKLAELGLEPITKPEAKRA